MKWNTPFVILILDVVQVLLMKKSSSYMTIGIAVGLFTATLIGFSVASYVKSRKSMSKRITVSDNTGISPPQYAAK
jgi:hypothetical protein